MPPDELTTIDYDALREEWEREWACEHARTELRCRVVSNGARHYFEQCLLCGEKGKAVKKADISDIVRDILPPFDEQLLTTFYDAKWADWRERQELIRQNENAAWWRWYTAYLDTPEWREKRQLVLRRDGGRCQGCLQRPAFHVHHLTYDRAGDELLIDLVALCPSCHQKAHPNKTIGTDD